MSREKEFDYVIGKLPRTDKDGNDTTRDKIGKGGRHRADGTYSSVVEDIQIIDDPTEVYDPEPRYMEPQRKRYEDFSPVEQIIIDVAGIAINRGMDFLTGWAQDSFESWLNEKRRKKSASKRTSTEEKRNIEKKRYTTTAERILAEMEEGKIVAPAPKTTTIVLPDVDTAYKQFTIDMTSEEAQKELLEAFILYLLAANKLQKVSNANIIDSAGVISTGQELIDKLSSKPLIDNVNSLLESNPNLLGAWQVAAFAEVLGRDPVVEGRFIPIDEHDLRERLLVMPEE